MNVDVDQLIATTESWLKEMEGNGEVARGVVLLCALQLFKEQKAKEEGAADGN